MPYSIEFTYAIGDRACITEIDVIGHVIGLYYGETGKQYQTTYFNGGEKVTAYLYDFQLSRAKDKKKNEVF